MKAIVIRRKADNKIEAFGPDNGNYAPSYNESLCVRSSEDYATAMAEWDSYPKPVPSRQAAKEAIQAYLDGTLTARDAIAAIKDAL